MARHKLAWGTVLLAAGWVALPAIALANFDAEAWRVARDIKAPEDAAGANARFALDDNVWDNTTGPDLRDLRLLRGEADDIGYAVYVPEDEPVRTVERRARVYNISKRGEEASELTIDLGVKPPMTNRIRIDTPSGNFGCAVTVEGSDDGQSWKTLRNDAAIFDFLGDIQKQFTTVTIPDTRMRYLRVIVAAPPNGKPIELSGATVFLEEPGRKSELPTLVDHPIRNRTETERDHKSWITLDLGAKNLPVRKITIETPQENFSRSVGVETSNDTKLWVPAGSGFIFRYRTERFREERLTLEIPEAFGRYVRLAIFNRDDPPLPLSRVTVEGRPRYVFFPFESGKPFRLFYGNRDARGAQYEYATVFPRIDRNQAVEVRLGEPRENPRFIATKADRTPPPWVERNQWVLYAALGIVVVALAAVALRSLRKPVDGEEPGDSPPAPPR